MALVAGGNYFQKVVQMGWKEIHPVRGVKIDPGVEPGSGIFVVTSIAIADG